MESIGEKIFSFPTLYNAKVAFLKKINGLSALSLNSLIENKEIIDIGCGSKSHFYTPEIVKKRTGIDCSPEMIASAKKLYPFATHYVASAENLPFADKSFDIAIIQFVLHHIEPDHWHQVLTEAQRVAKESIIILDHVNHDKLLPSCIQKTWWNLTDGGKLYRKEKEWQQFLSTHPLQVITYKRFGALFGNICYYHLKIR